jgi:hypothetical protein
MSTTISLAELRSSLRGNLMDKNLKGLLVFTMIYGLFAVGMLSIQPQTASVGLADGIGNLEVDAPSAIHLAMAAAE